VGTEFPSAQKRGSVGTTVIIRVKRDFKYFMLLKLAASKKRPTNKEDG